MTVRAVKLLLNSADGRITASSESGASSFRPKNWALRLALLGSNVIQDHDSFLNSRAHLFELVRADVAKACWNLEVDALPYLKMAANRGLGKITLPEFHQTNRALKSGPHPESLCRKSATGWMKPLYCHSVE
jgi:hypothetical protein